MIARAYFHHFLIRNEKETRAEMCPAIVSGIATVNAPVSYWLIVSLFLVTVPEVCARVNFSFLRDKLVDSICIFNK